MNVYVAHLLCVHPLCRRWVDHRKELRMTVRATSAAIAKSLVRITWSDPDFRRCRECRRPISLDHLQIWNTDGNGNETSRADTGSSE